MVRIFLLCLCVLAPLTRLKVWDIQPIEIFNAFLLCLLLAIVAHRGILKIDRDLWFLLRQYVLLFGATFVLAVAAQRLRFYPPPITSVLKLPLVISIVRIAQLSLVIALLIMVAEFLREDDRLVYFLARAYVWSGIINALFAIASWILLGFADADIGGAYDTFGNLRARAWFVEGGPFGVYIVSVMTVAVFERYALRRRRQASFPVTMGILSIALIMSGSKAGILLLVTLAGGYLLFAPGLRRAALLSTIVLAVGVFLVRNVLINGLAVYWQAYESLPELVQLHPMDGSLVEGRLAGSYIVPSVIAANPVLGVGIGNYSLVRNDPSYLGEMPSVDDWDLPGLGILSYLPELGIPLFLYLAYVLWLPAWTVWSRLGRSQSLVVLLAAYQFFAQVLGAQITFAYPWLLSGLALGYALSRPRVSRTLKRTSARELAH